MRIPAIKLHLLLISVTLAGCASTSVKAPQQLTTHVAPRSNTPIIGDSEGSFQRIYGKPCSVSKDGFYDYFDGQLMIQVHYANGIAESVLYSVFKGKPLDDYWTSRVLSLNSHGKAWIVKRDSKPNDIWYRTPDCKLIANFFKQRTLLVSNRQFRQWIWDQKGKGKLPAEQSKTSIFYPDCACVFLGESESKMTALLGNPSVSLINANVRIYRENNVTTRAQFKNGLCEAMKYVSTKGKFSNHWVSATLALNSKGVAWVVDEELKRGDKRFVTIDGKIHAVLKEKGHELMLYTEELNQRTMNRLDPKEAKIKSAVESQISRVRDD